MEGRLSAASQTRQRTVKESPDTGAKSDTVITFHRNTTNKKSGTIIQLQSQTINFCIYDSNKKNRRRSIHGTG